MTGNELHLITVGLKPDFMMRYTFPVKIVFHSIFSTSKIISKVNEFIQRSRSTVKMQENVLHGPDTSCICYNLISSSNFRDIIGQMKCDISFSTVTLKVKVFGL